jgi:hypothetical protein
MSTHGTRASIAGITLLLVLSAGAAAAQTSAPAKPATAPKAATTPKPPPAKAATAPKAAPAKAAPAGPAVGSWATYRWTSTLAQTVPTLLQQTGAGGQVTWSVGQESAPPPPLLVTYSIPRGDRQTYTLQIVTQARPDSRPLSVTQTTVNRRTGKAVRSVIRYPKGVIATPESGLRPFREAAVQGQREEVSVPAGRFTALHGAAQGADAWVSDQVPAMGLVKGVWREGTLELAGSGATGAQDLLKAGAK